MRNPTDMTVHETDSTVPKPGGSEPGLALIVGAARSGTTLLRLLLDAHTEIGCPSEAGVPALMTQMARVWAMIDADAGSLTAPGVDPGQPDPVGHDGQTAPPDAKGGAEQEPRVALVPVIPDEARDWIRAAIATAMRSYCDPRDKRLYVDKSLDSVYHLGFVQQVFPDARYVLAFRHVMDTIASGIEASPWGFHAYGYAPYVQASPGNSVAALARYWLDHVDAALAWEEQHPEACIRVRYEDLVANPEQTMLNVQAFLGVHHEPEVLQQAFEREPPRGPGDYKVEHTAAVHKDSIGRGKRIPVDMLPPALLSSLNEKLTALGYPSLGRSWNAAERGTETTTDTVWTQRLRELMADARATAQDSDVGSFALVAEDHLALRWVIDPESGTLIQGDGDVEAVLTGTTEDLVLMLTAEENLGVLLRSGRIRHVFADDEEAANPETRQRLSAIHAILRSCIANGEAQPVSSEPHDAAAPAH